MYNLVTIFCNTVEIQNLTKLKQCLFFIYWDFCTGYLVYLEIYGYSSQNVYTPNITSQENYYKYIFILISPN